MHRIDFLQWNWLVARQQCHLLIIILFYINLIQSRTVRFRLDEEIQLNTRIGSLLKYIQGGLNNLYFIKINNSDDASELFTVDHITGDITVVHRLDRELLCNIDYQNVKPGKYGKVIKEWIPNLIHSTICELYFSVNCLNTTLFSNNSNRNRNKIPVSNKLVVIFDIIIELRDINDNGCKFLPSDQQIIRIREDAPVNETRFTLNTPYDPDDVIGGNSVKQDRIWINTDSSIATSQSIQNYFKLHSFSSSKNVTTSNIYLELELIHKLDYEEQKTYTFEIVADDGYSSADHQCYLNVTVLVEDCNDHMPTFKQSMYIVNVSEDTPIGHLITQIEADDEDSDENGKIIYSFVSYSDDSDDGNYFYIHSETGEIKLQRRLNHRLKSSHSLKVFAKNPDNTTSRQIKSFHISKLSTTQVIVNVIDVNDHFPRIRIISPTGSKSLELIEETPPGQDIGIIDVFDGDTGKNAQVNCKLTNQTIPNVLRLISVDSEIMSKEMSNSNQKYKLTLQKLIDREEFPIIEFNVVCWDGGMPSLSSNLTYTVNVLDINDHDPVCDQNTYTIDVMEDSSPERNEKNFEFLTIHATDKDEGRNAKLHFSLDQETPTYIMNLITVNSTTGTLSTMGNLDREKLTKFSVTLICADHGEPKRMTKVKINVNVLDYNDNSPTYSQPYFEFTITENNNVSQLVGNFQITDDDVDKNAELVVQIEENTEQTHIYLASFGNSLGIHNDIKQLKLHSKDLIISTGLQETKHINEYIPHFKLHSQKFPRKNVSSSNNEPTLYDVKLYIESIIDREGLIMKYKDIVSNPFPNYGVLEHINHFYYDNRITELSSKTNYTIITPIILLLISAHDKGIPKLSEHVSIRIHVLDENDNSPSFIYPDPTDVNKTKTIVSYKEPLGYAFTQILAIDIDAGENGTILYFIHSGNDYHYFKLNPKNGILSINKKIPYTGIGEYLLTLEARDCGQPYRFTLTEFIIEIDQSPSKAYLTTNIYQLHNSNEIMNYGASGNTLNLYIIIAIITGACIISIILLFLVFLFLQRTKRNHNNRCNSIENTLRKYDVINMKELQSNFTTQSQHYNGNKYSDYEVHPFPNCSQQLPSYDDGNTNLELINHPNGSLFLLPVETDYNYGQNLFNKIPGNYWSTNTNIMNDNNDIVNMQTNENRINQTVSSYNTNSLYNEYTNYHNGDKMNITGCQDICQTILNGQSSIPFSISEACSELTNLSKHSHILMSSMDNWPKLSTTDFTSNIIIPTDCDSGNGDSVEIQPNLSTKVYFLGRT